MSLFIGKNTAGISILHMTKTEGSLVNMRDYPANCNTAFHSELNYLVATRWEGHTYYPSYTQSQNGWTYTFDALRLSAELIEYMRTHDHIGFIVFIGGVPLMKFAQSNVTSAQFIAFKYGNFFNNAVNYPTAICDCLMLPYEYALPASKDAVVYTFNVNRNGYIPLNKANNEIIINNSLISVRGINLAKLNYISTNKLNDGDIAMNSAYTTYNYNVYPPTPTKHALENVYLVQAITRTGNMELTKDYIKIGGYTLFSSALSAGNLQYKDMSTKVYAAPVNSATTYLISDFTFAANELFIVVNVYTGECPFFIPFKFRNGRIADIASYVNYNSMQWANLYLEGINNKLYLKFDANIGTADTGFNFKLIRFTG